MSKLLFNETWNPLRSTKCICLQKKQNDKKDKFPVYFLFMLKRAWCPSGQKAIRKIWV